MRLGDVGAGDLADLEAVLGRFKLTLEHLFVVDVERQYGLVAEHVQIGRRGGQQNVLFRVDQARALGTDGVFRPFRRRQRASAAVQRLGDRQADGCRIAVLRAVRGAQGGAVALIPGITGDGDRRPPVGQRLGHLFVRGAQARPAGRQGRVVGIGGNQRLSQGLRLGRRRRESKRTRKRRGTYGGAGNSGNILKWREDSRDQGRYSPVVVSG